MAECTKMYLSLFLKKSDLLSFLLSAPFSAFLLRARSRSIYLWLPRVIFYLSEYKVLYAIGLIKIDIMDRAINIINLIGWTFLLLAIEYELLFDLPHYL